MHFVCRGICSVPSLLPFVAERSNRATPTVLDMFFSFVRSFSTFLSLTCSPSVSLIRGRLFDFSTFSILSWIRIGFYQVLIVLALLHQVPTRSLHVFHGGSILLFLSRGSTCLPINGSWTSLPTRSLYSTDRPPFCPKYRTARFDEVQFNKL